MKQTPLTEGDNPVTGGFFCERRSLVAVTYLENSCCYCNEIKGKISYNTAI